MPTVTAQKAAAAIRCDVIRLPEHGGALPTSPSPTRGQHRPETIVWCARHFSLRRRDQTPPRPGDFFGRDRGVGNQVPFRFLTPFQTRELEISDLVNLGGLIVLAMKSASPL